MMFDGTVFSFYLMSLLWALTTFTTAAFVATHLVLLHQTAPKYAVYAQVPLTFSFQL